MNKVSILIPNYNGEKWLAECLTSATSQDYISYDIIVIDDASTDSSVAIILEFQKKYPFIKLLQNSINQGVSFSRNRGIKESTSLHIAFLDSDDMVSNKWLSTIMQAIEKDSLDVCGCWLQTLSKSKLHNTTYRVSKKYSQILSELWFIGGSIGGLIVQRKICLDFPFNTLLILFEDMDFYSKLLSVTEKISNVQKSLYFYRRHISNTTKTSSKNISITYSRANRIPKKHLHLADYIITLGAVPTIKNIALSFYLGGVTLTTKNYLLYLKLVSYYILKHSFKR